MLLKRQSAVNHFYGAVQVRSSPPTNTWKVGSAMDVRRFASHGRVESQCQRQPAPCKKPGRYRRLSPPQARQTAGGIPGRSEIRPLSYQAASRSGRFRRARYGDSGVKRRYRGDPGGKQGCGKGEIAAVNPVWVLHSPQPRELSRNCAIIRRIKEPRRSSGTHSRKLKISIQSTAGFQWQSTKQRL
jgi:hypothetical protein